LSSIAGAYSFSRWKVLPPMIDGFHSLPFLTNGKAPFQQTPFVYQTGRD
jgi:hypothetical protein